MPLRVYNEIIIIIGYQPCVARALYYGRCVPYARAHVLPHRFTETNISLIFALISAVSAFKMNVLGSPRWGFTARLACCVACGSFAKSIPPRAHYKIMMFFHVNTPLATPLMTFMRSSKQVYRRASGSEDKQNAKLGAKHFRHCNPTNNSPNGTTDRIRVPLEYR